MAKIPEAPLAQFIFTASANAAGGGYIALNSNITQQVRLAFNVGAATYVALADSVPAATNTSQALYVRAGASGPDFTLCATPSKLWVQGATTSAPVIYCSAWTLETADLA
jgi:H2-forming N5,N10-methylenetetrahydromethanopterin dehydrogenase-like enzyme